MIKPQVYRQNAIANPKRFNPRRDRDLMYKSDVWKKYAIVFLNINRDCYACGERATVIDHIIAHKGDAKKFMDLLNHMALCKRCHDTCTASFDHSEIPRTKEKLEWLDKQRKLKNITSKVRVLPKYGR